MKGQHACPHALMRSAVVLDSTAVIGTVLTPAACWQCRRCTQMSGCAGAVPGHHMWGGTLAPQPQLLPPHLQGPPAPLHEPAQAPPPWLQPEEHVLPPLPPSDPDAPPPPPDDALPPAPGKPCSDLQIQFFLLNRVEICTSDQPPLSQDMLLRTQAAARDSLPPRLSDPGKRRLLARASLGNT